jgi:NTP pyrophosphatase (non-canonical NTP hydrolase)
MSKTSNGEADRLLRCGALLADSPTFKHVLDFAFRMEAKLAKNRHKGDRDGWLKDDPWCLVERILEETVEVQKCFTMGSDDRVDYDDAEELADECADVANFCMMVADSVTTQESANG